MINYINVRQNEGIMAFYNVFHVNVDTRSDDMITERFLNSYSARPCSRTAVTGRCTTGKARHRSRPPGPHPAESSAAWCRSYRC